jgi:hypothetical protein
MIACFCRSEAGFDVEAWVVFAAVVREVVFVLLYFEAEAHIVCDFCYGLLKLLSMLFLSRQNLRPRPSSWSVPEGGVILSHRLWKALLRGAIRSSRKSSE